ncbi:isoleucine--tRNA ligase, partial [bacterium]
AFNEKFKYAVIQVDESENENVIKGEKYIIADELKNNFCEKMQIAKFTVVKTVEGKELENLKCQSPFREKESVGVLADFVTLEDGTGVVHIAPGHGEDDYKVGLKYNLPIITPVNDSGKFTKEVPAFEGKDVFEANKFIIIDLNDRKLLLSKENISHSYPHCWRCKQPIVFRATSQWFLSIDKDDLRKKLIDTCGDVKWIPELGYNRITSMIENRPDWCLSRQRLWGTPVPVFYCQDCGKELMTEESIESVAKVFEERGSDSWFYLEVKDFLGDDIKCECGSSNFTKETDILDVWFDSGVSHEAVLKVRENLSWPSDLYLEGSDQHRGWFQTSLIPSVILNRQAPYKQVLTHGFTVDGEGKKMSKSQGNVTAPQEIIQKYGADIIRLWVLSENYKEDVRISDEIIEQLVDAYRKIRNTARYLLGNLANYNHNENEVEYEKLLDIDKWALAKLAFMYDDICNAYEKKELHNVFRKFYNFCTVELSSLYFDILKDRLYVSHYDSIERRSAQTVLYYLVTWLTRLIAPSLSFTSEEIWKAIPNQKIESIFLSDFPGTNEDEQKLINTWKENTALKDKWDDIFEFRKIILKKIEEKRQEQVIGNSLEAKVKVFLDKNCEILDLLQGVNTQWATISIVSQFEIIVSEVDDKDLISEEFLPQGLKGSKVKIGVEKAAGKKCERCWNYSQAVGSIKNYENFCVRCAEVVKNW